MNILGIETSCDETAVAIVRAEGELLKPTFAVLGSALYSQAILHKEYGGVFPNLAKREHVKNILPLLEKALSDAGLLVKKSSTKKEEKNPLTFPFFTHEPGLEKNIIEFLSKFERPSVDAIAVTEGPGLAPALWVGINVARALALAWNLPLVPTNHMEGHIVSPLVQASKKELGGPKVHFPLLAVLISGGHTELVRAEEWGSYKILGQTRDDAVGEAFDKVARMMNLPYPGGPEISKLAEKARERKGVKKGMEKEAGGNEISLPRPMINTNDFEFSFSGLKTAALYLIKKLGGPEALSETQKENIACEFENAVIEVLVTKTRRAINEYSTKTLIVAGGVIANTALRKAFEALAAEFKNEDVSPAISLLIPTRDLATDNATMIAMAGYLRFAQTADRFTPKTPIEARGNLRLREA